MSDTPQEQEVPKQPTPEEIKMYKAKMLAYYEDQLPLLKVQAEVEMLMANIDQARLNSYVARTRLAEMMAPPTDSKETEKPKE